MTSLYNFSKIPKLPTRLLSVQHTFRNNLTSDMNISHSFNAPNFCALSFRKYCTLQIYNRQQCSISSAYPLMALSSRDIDLLHKCTLWSNPCNERNMSSQQTSSCPFPQINPSSNPDKSRPSPKSKNSLAVGDDELMFFDKFMSFHKKDEVPVKPDNPIPLQKYYFSPTNKMAERTPEEIQNYLAEHEICLDKADVPPPIIEFCDVEFPAPIMKLLEKNYSAPTPIQAMGWSLALSGKDVVGIGQTGSGKTLAYILPGLLHTAHQQKVLAEADPHFNCHSPVAIVLAPSRELATQVARVARQYSAAMGVEVLLATGGVKREKHLNAIWSTKPKFVVATPGRFLDLLRTKQMLLNHCSFLVLDEADRMLDMGFEAQIRSIVELARSDRQTLLWSATWPVAVQKLASSMVQEDAVQLSVGSTELRANPNIEQRVHVCEFLEKTQLLKKLLREMLKEDPNNKALVFVQSKRNITKLFFKLQRSGFKCNSLHADLDQPLRDRILSDFRKGQYCALIATNLAARGLDIKGLSCVINYDFPDNLETYIHRIGRTGRAGERGIAHTFFSERNIRHAPKFVQLLRETGHKVDTKLLYMAAKASFLPESRREIFLPFVPEKTVEGHQRSQSIMGGRSGTLLGPVDPGTVSPREYAMNQAELLQQAKLQAKLAKKDKSKIVDTKYCIQKKR